MLKTKLKAACFCMLFFSLGLRAQMSGAYTVPGTFSTIAAAISSLNAVGVSGAVTINIAAGYTETAVSGGYTLNALTGASAANQVYFMKSGTGANPRVMAYSGGTATPADAVQDGVWRFNGADYITVDGIDIMDGNTSNPSTMEFGYGFFKAGVTNGCQNNTIKNCVITLNRINNDQGTSPAANGSRGIDVVNAVMNDHITALTVTSAAGANSNNRFYANTVQNCNVGIALMGYVDSSPYAYADFGNEVGGTASANGNTIVDFGGGGSNSAAFGVQTLAQYSLNIRNNMINSNTGAGVDHPGDLAAIYLDVADEADLSITGNTLSIHGGGTSENNLCIYNGAGDYGSTNTINITNNLITGCTYSTATNPYYVGIYNYAGPGDLNITGNTISNNSTNAYGGGYYGILNDGYAVNTINISNNLVGLGTFNALTDLVLGGIYNEASTSTLSINSNTFQSLNYMAGSNAGSSYNPNYMIYNGYDHDVVNINNNRFNNLSVNTTADTYLIFDDNSSPNVYVNNNAIVGSFAITGSGGGSMYGYYNYGSPSSGTTAITNNNFSNITLAGGSEFTGIFQATSRTQVENVNSNLISNVTTDGYITGIYHSYGKVGSTVMSNTITNLAGAQDVYGMYVGDSRSAGNTVSQNIIQNCSTSGGSSVFGIYHYNSTNVTISRNKITNLSGSDPGCFIEGIYANSASSGNIDVYNNVVGDLSAPASNSYLSIIGIELGDANTTNVSYNSVYLSASSNGADFGSAALYASDYPSVTMKNNILVNTSAANGSGVAAAYMRSSNDLSTYAISSNHNLFYAGFPGLQHALFYDGTTPVLGINALQTLFLGADAGSVTENPPFLSTVGTATNFLNISTTVATQVEGGATPVAGITTDYNGTTRSGTAPDIGAFEGTYQPFVGCTSAPQPGAAAAANTLICTNSSNLIVLPLTNTVTGLSYQWQQSTAGVGGPYTSISGATTTLLDAVMGSSTIWYRAITTCSAGGSATSTPVQVGVGVSAPASIATSTMVCSNQQITLGFNAGFGADYNFQWQSASALAGPYTSVPGATLNTYDATNITANTWYQAVISCTASATASTVSTPVSIVPMLPVVYAPVPFLETFDQVWENRCDIRNVPRAAFWTSNPTTDNESWRRQNDGNSANWTGPGGGSIPAYAGGGSARFHSYYAPNGNTGSLDLHLNIPSATSNYSLSFYYINQDGSDSLEVLLSTDGGTTFNKIGGYTVTASGGYEKKVIDLGAVNSSSCIITFSATSDYGGTDIGMDSVEVKACPNFMAISSASSICTGTGHTLTVTGDAPRYYLNNAVLSSSVVASMPTASAIYSVTASNGLCAVSRTVGLTVNISPSLTLNGSTGICTGQTATLAVTGTADTYSWSTGATTSTISDMPTSNITYTVVGTNTLGGCQVTLTKSVAVAASLPVSILGSSVVCEGQALNLTANGGVTYTWSTTETTSLITTPTLTANTTFTLIGASGTCTNSAVKTISVNPTPTVSITGNFTVCSGQTTTLTGNGADTYSWSTSATSTNIAVTLTNSATYTVTGTNTLGCTATKTIAVSTNTLPVITVAQSATAACAQVPVTFTASGATNYTWTSGPTNSVYVVTPVTANANGVYTVTGINPENCISTQTIALVTYSLPVVNISPASPTVCSGAPLNFTATGASSYAWTGGPTTNTYALNPTTPATYTVTGTSAAGCVFTKTVGVSINALPTINAVASTATACSQSAVSFTASGGSTYLWSANAATGSIITVYPSNSTTYTVTGTDANGCASTGTVAVTTLALPTITVSPALSTVCVNSSATFTANGAITYTWNNTSTITGSTAVITTTGLSSYNVSGTDANGCMGNASFLVFTNPLPVIGISASSQTVCSLSAATFTASGANTYVWNATQTGGVITVNPASSTVYTVTGTNTLTGCSATQTVAIATLPLPVISVSPASPTVCANSPLTLTGSGGSTYHWSTGSINNSINLTPTVNISYTLTGTDALGCSADQVVNVSVNALPTIVAASQTVCIDDVATFAPSGAATYTLMPGNLTTYTVSQSVQGIYNYTITGTDANSCVNKTFVSLDVETCTGIKAHTLSENVVRVYPNPSHGVFTASFGFSGEKKVMITSSVGQLIAERITSASEEVFDISHLAKGVYFINVSSTEASGNYKIIIE